MSKVAAWGCLFPFLTVAFFVAAIFCNRLLPGWGTRGNFELGFLPAIWSAGALVSIHSRTPPANDAQLTRGYAIAFASWPIFALIGYFGYLR